MGNIIDSINNEVISFTERFITNEKPSLIEKKKMERKRRKENQKRIRDMKRYIYSYNKKYHKQKSKSKKSKFLPKKVTFDIPEEVEPPKVPVSTPEIIKEEEVEQYDDEVQPFSKEEEKNTMTYDPINIPSSPRLLRKAIRPDLEKVNLGDPCIDFIPIKPIRRPIYTIRNSSNKKKKVPSICSTYEEHCQIMELFEELMRLTEEESILEKEKQKKWKEEELEKQRLKKEEQEAKKQEEAIYIRFEEREPFMIPKEHLVYPEGHLCEGLYYTNWDTTTEEYIQMFGEPALEDYPLIFTIDVCVEKFKEKYYETYPHLKPSWSQIATKK